MTLDEVCLWLNLGQPCAEMGDDPVRSAVVSRLPASGGAGLNPITANHFKPLVIPG